MKRSIAVIFFLLSGCLYVQAQENNDFYDNTPARQLKCETITVQGEITNPGPVTLSRLPLRSVIIREAVFKGDKQTFIGSYRYDGYSLFDILKERYVQKKNRKEFGSVIDLLVSVENMGGEKVIFSWGEIFYPTVHHRIIIATRVSPIIPSKTKEQWPLPDKAKVVCAADLVSARNIASPSKITIFSAPLSFKGKKSAPMISPAIKVYQEKTPIKTLGKIGPQLPLRQYPSVFYGRGRGFHGIQYFKGVPMKLLFKKIIPFNRENIRRTYLVVAGLDGYRITLSYSELANRNDQEDFLLTDAGQNKAKGRFRIFPTPDFFSDRAVFAIAAIHVMVIK